MANIFASIAVSPSGATLLNALQVTTSAGTVLNEAVTEVDASNPNNVGSILASGARLVEPGGVNVQPVSGTITTIAPFTGAPAATAPGTAAFVGVRAATAYPTAVTNGQLVGPMGDKAGRLVAVLLAPRDLITSQSLSLTATGSTQLIAVGGANVFTDIVTLIITNPMTTAATLVISDGTNTYSLNFAANGGMVNHFTVPLKASTANTAWNYNLGGAGTLTGLLQYVSNQ